MQPFVVWLDQVGKDDLLLVGGKAANLGEMIKLGLPVPAGFAVTTFAFEKFLEANGLDVEIWKKIKQCDVENTHQLLQTSKQIKEMIVKAEIPKLIEKIVLEAYDKLSYTFEKIPEKIASLLKMRGPALVAVRSSATAEDLPTASFAGQQATFLNVKGNQALIEAIKKCWASLFEPRAIYYRAKHKITKASISVIVQKMVNSEASGVMFTVDPVTGEDFIVIEATWGLGETLVSGAVEPDFYKVDKNSFEIVEIKIGKKELMRIRDYKTDNTIEIEVPKEMANKQVLSEEQIKQLAKYGIVLEKHYKKPQDIEFAVERGKVYIVQTRAITAVGKKEEVKVAGKQLLKGIAASPGVATGKVKIVHGLQDITKVEPGDILVTRMTSPDLVPTMSKAAAIITDEGGRTCVAGDTLLLTNKGFIKAKELYQRINNGEVFSILSFDASTKSFKFRKIIAAGRNKKKVITVQISNKPKNKQLDILRISPDHKFITFLNGELTKIPLEKILKLKFGVLIPEKIPGFMSKDIGNNLSYILGLTVADGYLTLTNRRGVPTLSQKLEGKRKKVAQRFALYLKLLTQKEPKFYPKIAYSPILRGRVVNTQNNNYNIVSKLSSLINRLDTTILSLNEKNLYHFLSGVLDGDGLASVGSKRLHIYLDPSKFNVYAGIMLSLLRLGIHPQVVFNRNIINLQVVERLNDLTKHAARFWGIEFQKRKKHKSTRYFVARQILEEVLPKISYKGRLKVYLKNNLLIGEKVVEEIIKECKKKGIETKKLEEVLRLPLRQSRVRKIRDDGIKPVYNFEVEGKSELDKNFVVFTNTLTPVLVSNSHAAIVSREMGIPCVVGTREATKMLKDGMLVTVDAYNGIIYEGKQEIKAKEVELEKIETKTKVKVNLAFAVKDLEKIAEATDGVGLLRIEHLITQFGVHPAKLIKEGKKEEYKKILIEGIEPIAKAFYPKPVWVRTLDARSDEFRHLAGGQDEPKEANPMLGWHGIRRSLDEPELLKAELEAIKELHEKGYTNLAVMLPFVINVDEFRKAKQIAEAIGYKGKIGIMVETPAAALLIEDFCKAGISFASIGSNDLTMLTLGIDRNNEKIAKLYDEKHKAVLELIKNVIKKCKKYGIESSICGEAPSNYPEIIEFLVKNGIDSISVNLDAINKVRLKVKEVEAKNVN